MFGDLENNRLRFPKKTLAEIALIVTGSTPSTHNTAYWNGAFPWVSAQDMKYKYIRSTAETLSLSGYNTCKKIPAGSVLFVCRGSIGTMAITTIECAMNQSICAATNLKDVNPEYLYAALLLQREHIQKIGCGTSFKSINQTTFSTISVIVPPLTLQNEFATFSEQLDKSKFSVVFYVYGPVFPVFCRGPPEKSFFYRKFVTQMPDVFTFFQNDIGG